MTQSPAGWYPDPYGTPQLRWWDGSQWTDATHSLEVVAAQNAQVAAQAGAGTRSASDAFPGSGTSSGSTGPHSGPHGAPQAGTAVEGPPEPEPAPGSSPADDQDTAEPSASGKKDAASGETNTASSGTSDTDAPASGTTGTDAASPASATPTFAPPATGDVSPTAATAQWSSPGGPSQRGDTAYLPVPDLPQRQSKPMAAWIAGGVAAAVVIVLLIVGTIYLTGNRDTPAGDTGVASSPTTNAESSPSPTPSQEEPPQTASGRITDRVSGLSYAFPGSPWQLLDTRGIDFSNPEQQWSSGFQALSQDDYELGKDWFGTVLAGSLADNAPYGGPDSMRDVANKFLSDNERALYEPPHERRILEDKAITVSGRPAWLLRFEMDFTEQSEANRWRWKKEYGAIVLVDRGEANPPSLLFATVPDNLDTGVIDQVLSSLRVQ